MIRKYYYYSCLVIIFIFIIRHSRIYTIWKMFDCKKCPLHLGSFIKHHGLFVPYIVHIFDCEKCPVHLVSFIKHHGLFVPYIDDIFIFLIRRSWLSPSYIHPFTESKSTFFILGPWKTRLLNTVEALTNSLVYFTSLRV